MQFSSLKLYPVWQTWFLLYFKLGFYKLQQAEKSSSNWEKIQFIKLENCKNQVQIDRRKDSCFQFIAVLNLLTGGRTMFFTFLVVFWGAQKFIDIFFFFIHVYQSSVNWLEPCLEEDLYLKINRDQMIFLFFLRNGLRYFCTQIFSYFVLLSSFAISIFYRVVLAQPSFPPQTTYSWNIKWRKSTGISGLWVLTEIIHKIPENMKKKNERGVLKLPVK